ncbi:MAG: putative phage abortive infection protein [Saprospiraceae bacterium]|nr:hypothetical protein [Lewinella sp.]
MSNSRIQEEVKSRIAKGLNFGIEAVEDVLAPNAPIYNDFILLKSKYNDLMYISTMNTMPYDQIEIGMDRLRTALLQLVDRLDESSLEKDDIQADLKVQALPTRRTNFFKLLDIHFKNLDAIQYVEVSDRQESRESGREAIYLHYNLHRRSLRNRDDVKAPDGQNVLQSYFYDYFHNETGKLEVYFKNIKHMLAYTLSSEIERRFFLDTLRSLFSKFELATIYYYVLSEIDLEFNAMVEESKLLAEGSYRDVLIR